MFRALNKGARRIAANYHVAPQWTRGGRSVWTETPGAEEARDRESFYDSTVAEYAAQPIERLSLQQMLEFGRDAWFDPSKVLKSARHCQRELPKRLARRLLDLQLLPFIVVANPHIQRVYHAYYHAFDTLRSTRPAASLRDNEALVALLRRLVDEHAPMLDALATGLRELRSKPVVGGQLRLDGFLENMLRSRISRRVLAEQHINLTNGRPGYIGIICTNLSLADSVDLAAQRCRQVCIETYGAAPDVSVTGDAGLALAYIPAHLDYVLYELLKNASRAVVERHRGGGPGGGPGVVLPLAGRGTARRPRLPPLQVRLCNAGEEAAIRISDQGGGIPAGQVDRVWEYGWTSSSSSSSSGARGSEEVGASGEEGLGMDSSRPGGWLGGAAEMSAGGGGGPAGRYRMAGLGFGLPLSRLYARYFGGDLQLVSVPGYGVDAYLNLKRLEGCWQEAHVEESSSAVEAVRHA